MTTTTPTNQLKNDISSWDATHDSRETFMAFLRAQSAPGQPSGPVPSTGHCSDRSIDTAAAVLLALLDSTTSLAVEGQAVEDFAWLYTATGAPAAPVSEADFVLATHDLAGVISAAQRGTATQPEYGATVIFAGADFNDAHPVTIAGPGIAQPVNIAVPLSAAAITARAAANAAYPMGIDLVITHGNQLVAFPRSTQINMEGVEDVRGNARN
jgi:alpha-D-ribose 1-methylphosphonate 5-triphosphate synthase subunit PhnH